MEQQFSHMENPCALKLVRVASVALLDNRGTFREQRSYSWGSDKSEQTLNSEKYSWGVRTNQNKFSLSKQIAERIIPGQLWFQTTACRAYSFRNSPGKLAIFGRDPSRLVFP